MIKQIQAKINLKMYQSSSSSAGENFSEIELCENDLTIDSVSKTYSKNSDEFIAEEDYRPANSDTKSK